MPALPPLDFPAALAAKERTAEVRLGGETVKVRRARLGLHLELQLLREEAGDSLESAPDYVLRASGHDPLLEEIAAAFAALTSLNEPIGYASLIRAATRGAGPPAALRYRGRGIAAIVNELAWAYGWSADYILNELGPEEAWCYLQEVQVSRHDEQHFLYGLSTVGRDKRGKQKAFPSLPWLKLGTGRSGRSPPRPVPARFQPAGTIIRFERNAS